jgi:hypothetical protein
VERGLVGRDHRVRAGRKGRRRRDHRSGASRGRDGGEITETGRSLGRAARRSQKRGGRSGAAARRSPKRGGAPATSAAGPPEIGRVAAGAPRWRSPPGRRHGRRRVGHRARRGGAGWARVRSPGRGRMLRGRGRGSPHGPGRWRAPLVCESRVLECAPRPAMGPGSARGWASRRGMRARNGPCSLRFVLQLPPPVRRRDASGVGQARAPRARQR